MSRPIYAMWHVLGSSEHDLRSQLEHVEDIPFPGFVSSWNNVLAVVRETARLDPAWRSLPNGIMYAMYFRGAWAAWAARPYILEDAPGVALGLGA